MSSNMYNMSVRSLSFNTTTTADDLIGSNESTTNLQEPPWVTYNQALFIWYIASIVICAVSSSANILLVVVIAKNRFLHSGSGMVIAHLAGLEFFASFVNMPIHMTTIFILRYDIHPTKVSCAVTQFFLALTYTAASWTLFLLAVNRFVAVYLPNTYNNITTQKVLSAGIATIWIVSIALNLMFCFDVQNRFGLTVPWQTCAFSAPRRGEYDFRGLQIAFTLYIPLGLVGLLYLAVLVKFIVVWKSRQVEPITYRSPRAWRERVSQYRRMVFARILFLCWAAYCLCFFSNSIINKFCLWLIFRFPVIELWTRTAYVVSYVIHPLFLFCFSDEHKQGLCVVFGRQRRPVSASRATEATSRSHVSSVVHRD